MTRRSRTVAAVLAVGLVATLGPSTASPEREHREPGVNEHNVEAIDGMIALLTGEDAPDWARDTVQLVVTRRGAAYEVHGHDGAIRFTRTPADVGWTFDVEVLRGVNPIAEQDHTGFTVLDDLLAVRHDDDDCEPLQEECHFLVDPEAMTFPDAYERIAAAFESHRTGDMVIVPRNDGPYSTAGAHGHLGIVQSKTALVVAGRGARQEPLTAEEQESLRARTVDVTPTVAAALGVRPYAQDTGQPALLLNGAESETALLRRQDGRVLTELLDGDPAARGVVFMWDSNNPVMLRALLDQPDPSTGEPFAPCQEPPHPDDPLPNVRCLVSQGTFSTHGATAAWPSVSFPNHVSLGTGAYPGNHGLVGNSWYERRDQRTEQLLPTDPQNPVSFFTESLISPEVETIFEAVHRSFGSWFGGDDVAPDPDGAYTASLNSPMARGATFASTEMAQRPWEPAFLANVPRLDEFFEDLTRECADAHPDTYYALSAGDHTAQAQMRTLYENPTHPMPTFVFINFSLMDSVGHALGAYHPCTAAAYRDSDSRLGRILTTMREQGAYEDAFFVLTGDHAMENQRVAQSYSSVVAEHLRALGYRFELVSGYVYVRSMDVTVSPEEPRAGEETTITVSVRDDDTGDPVGGATVVVETGDEQAEGQTDEALAPSRVTVPYPREISRRVNEAQDTVGVDLGNHPTIENPLRAVTDSSGQVTLTVTPAMPRLTVHVAHPDFNDRELRLRVRPAQAP